MVFTIDKLQRFSEPRGSWKSSFLALRGGEVHSRAPVTLGAFLLPDIVLDLFSSSPFMGNFSVDTIPDTTLRNKTQVVEQVFYIGNDPNNATLGDMRISYEIIEPATVSIVAKQSSTPLQPIQPKPESLYYWWKKVSVARDKATPNAWILRVCCPIIVWLGLILLWASCPALVAISPVLSDMVDRLAYGCLIPAALVISVTAVSLVWLSSHYGSAAARLRCCCLLHLLVPEATESRKATKRRMRKRPKTLNWKKWMTKQLSTPLHLEKRMQELLI